MPGWPKAIKQNNYLESIEFDPNSAARIKNSETFKGEEKLIFPSHPPPPTFAREIQNTKLRFEFEFRIQIRIFDSEFSHPANFRSLGATRNEIRATVRPAEWARSQAGFRRDSDWIGTGFNIYLGRESELNLSCRLHLKTRDFLTTGLGIKSFFISFACEFASEAPRLTVVGLNGVEMATLDADSN